MREPLHAERDALAVRGFARVRLIRKMGTPFERLLHEETVENSITQIGRRYILGRAVGVAGAEGQVTGMKLGLDSATVPSVTGAGAALVSYIAGSQKAVDGGFPTEAAQGNGSRATWQTTWGAGVVTNADIEEVALVNDALADANSLAADTVGRILISQVNKGSLDSLVVSWTWDVGV